MGIQSNAFERSIRTAPTTWPLSTLGLRSLSIRINTCSVLYHFLYVTIKVEITLSRWITNCFLIIFLKTLFTFRFSPRLLPPLSIPDWGVYMKTGDSSRYNYLKHPCSCRGGGGGSGQWAAGWTHRACKKVRGGPYRPYLGLIWHNSIHVVNLSM